MLKNEQIYTLDIQLNLEGKIIDDVIVKDKKNRKQAFSKIKTQHVSLIPNYDYQVYCSYMNYALTDDEASYPLLRVFNSEDNAHVEMIDQSNVIYNTYNINTNGAKNWLKNLITEECH